MQADAASNLNFYDLRRQMDKDNTYIARRVAAEYAANRKFVKTMESVRPSILSRLGINTEGYLSFEYELPDRRIPKKDRSIVESGADAGV